MSQVKYTEADLYAVALAGDPHLRTGVAPSDDEMALISALVEVEVELREAEWRSLEVLLPHAGVVDGKVKVVPPAGPEGARVAIAVWKLGWVSPDAGGCQP